MFRIRFSTRSSETARRLSRLESLRPLLLPLLFLLAPSCCSAPAWAQSAPQATTVSTQSPTGVAYDASGNLYIALQDDHKVIMVSTAGLISNIAGTGEQGFAGDGGPATSALLDSPQGIALDSSGSLFIADTHNHRIRKVTNGTITTIAGNGIAGFSGDAGPAAAAQMDRPVALAVDASGNLYLADSDNHRVRKISAGIITTIAGNGEQAFSGDGGAATSAGLDTPNGIAISASGVLYISDTNNQRIRVVSAAGIISTVTGTGTKGFAGDGSAATGANLARPQGLALDSSGNLFFADSDNNRIRTVSGGTVTTVAGDGEQGASGDTGSPTSAVLDTPTAVALGPGGLFTLSDTHNQRTRTIDTGTINTVAGIPPLTAEGIVLSGSTSFPYKSGTLTATFTNGSKTATGSATLLDGASPAGTAPFSANQASLSLGVLHAGIHTVTVTYPGDTQNAATASGVFVLTVTQAAQTIAFPQPATPVMYKSGASDTLAATASSGLPITYTVSGPATLNGSTITYTGPGTVTVTASAGNGDYLTATATRTIVVTNPAITIASLSPAAVPLGASATTITVAGSGFASDTILLVNGVQVSTTFINASTLTTTLPASDFTSVQTIQVSVFSPSQNQTAGPLPFSVTAPAVNIAVTAPPTSNPGTQPQVTLTLANPYPVPVDATLTLTFTPGANGVNDPAVVFTNGLRTLTLHLAANQATIPVVPIQTGTVTGVIQITLSLTAGGVNVTPANLSPTIITVPPTAPTITQLTLTRSGKTLTVFAQGYSDTRQLTKAHFHFTPIPGATIKTQDLNIDVTTAFTAWFSQAASNAYGSAFLYTQTFTLDNDSSIIGQVTVTFDNSAGTSIPATSP